MSPSSLKEVPSDRTDPLDRKECLGARSFCRGQVASGSTSEGFLCERVRLRDAVLAQSFLWQQVPAMLPLPQAIKKRSQAKLQMSTARSAFSETFSWSLDGRIPNLSLFLSQTVSSPSLFDWKMLSSHFLIE